MKLNLRKKDNYAIIELNGSLDIYTSIELKEFIEKNITTLNENVILDMENLNYIDSSGIGMLIKEMNYTQELKGEFFLVKLKPQIEKVLKVSGLTTFFNTMSEEEFKSKFS